MTENLLKSIYYDVSNPSSFGSVDKLYRAAKAINSNIKLNDVESFLSGELAYTLHKNVVRKFKRNPVIASHFRDLAQADLIDVSRYAKENENNNFILTVIDVFTKYAFALPIKTKTAANVAKAFETILETYRPNNLQCDEGKEFTNKTVQSLLKEYLINFYLAKNERIKCAVVERFQRTLMTKLHKYFTSKGTHKYLDVLPDVLNSYNNCYHRSIRMTPTQATTADATSLFSILYGVPSMRHLLKMRKKNSAQRNIGDHVRVPTQKHKFQKGYTQSFTDEIFKVSNINRAFRVPVYRLEDHKGKIIRGNFYPEELQKVKNEDKYRIKVLDERVRRGKKETLVEWENFPNLEPEWIPSSQIESLA